MLFLVNKPEQAIVFPLELKIIQVNSLYLQTIKKIISNHFGLKYMTNLEKSLKRTNLNQNQKQDIDKVCLVKFLYPETPHNI